MPVLDNSGDSIEAARRLADLGVECVVTLGGDGTNRAVAKGIGDVPLVAISTGTNNVFPAMLEGTVAGLAAGLVATCAAARSAAVRRAPRLDVYLDGNLRDIALIDVVTSRLGWIGARALWDPAHLREIVVSRIDPARIGMCAIGGMLYPEAVGHDAGIHIRIGAGRQKVLAPIAPGLVRTVPIAASSLVEMGSRVLLDASPCVVALDGEREFEIMDGSGRLEVHLNPDGPNVVDVSVAIAAGAIAGALLAAGQ
jgi:predicted polyphosphate/ATP-dependent NAD kinase